MTVNVRFPTEIHAQIVELAEEEDRSLNGEIVHAVRQYIASKRRRESGLLRCAEPPAPYDADR